MKSISSRAVENIHIFIYMCVYAKKERDRKCNEFRQNEKVIFEYVYRTNNFVRVGKGIMIYYFLQGKLMRKFETRIYPPNLTEFNVKLTLLTDFIGTNRVLYAQMT